MNAKFADKVFRISFALAFVLGITGMPYQRAQAQESTPIIISQLMFNSVDFLHWPVGTTVEFSIDDPDPNNPDFSGGKCVIQGGIPPNESYCYFGLGDFRLKPGQWIVASADTQEGIITKSIRVTNVRISSVNPETNVIQGVAELTDRVVHINLVGHTASRDVVPNADGTWKADFSDIFDIEPEFVVSAGQTFNDDGGSSIWYRSLDDFILHVVPDNMQISGFSWQWGSNITITIDDDINPDNGILYSRTQNADDDTSCGYPCFNLREQYLEGVVKLTAGQYVIMTDNVVTKTVKIAPFTIRSIDADMDTISGVADPGSRVLINILSQGGIYRYATTESNGTWSIDFSVDGIYINPGDYGYAIQLSQDGTLDGTLEDWYAIPGTTVKQPFVVYSAENLVLGFNFDFGTPVTLTIDDPDGDYDITLTKNANMRAGEERCYPDWCVLFQLPDSFQLHGGQVVHLTTPDQIDMTHTVTSLAITTVDKATSTFSGTADPSSTVDLFAGTGKWLRVITGDNGRWFADFSGFCDFSTNLPCGGGVSQANGDGMTRIDWYSPPSPEIYVRLLDNIVDSGGWYIYDDITLTVANEGSQSVPLIALVLKSDVWGGLSINLTDYDFQLEEGQIVTLTDDVDPKTVVLPHDIVIDPDTDTISGYASSGDQVHVWVNGGSERWVTAGLDGYWEADFAQDGIKYGNNGGIEVTDEDDDQVRIDWRLPNPVIKVWLGSNNIDGYDWKPNTLVTVTVGNYSDQQYSDNWGNLQFHPGNKNFTLAPGQIVTMTDEVNTRTHTVLDVAVTGADIDTDTVTGTAAPDSNVDVCLRVNGCIWRYVTANENGMWMADYSQPGPQPGEEQIWDIKLGDSLDAARYDNAGNGTGYDFWLPNPSFGVRTNDDKVEGWQWTPGTTITVTVDDPNTPDADPDTPEIDPDIIRTADVYEASWNPGEFRFDLDLKGVIDIQPEFVVTASDGTITKTHTVTSLAFTDINVNIDTVTGAAAPNSNVDVWTCDNNRCYNVPTVTANDSGIWVANFTGVYDIVPGTWIDSSQGDDDGDSTFWGQRLPNPAIKVWLGSNNIDGYDWMLNTLVTVAVVGTDYSDQEYSDDWGNLQFHPWEKNFTVVPGQIVTMTDGVNTRTHTVLDISVTGVDIETDIVSGMAAPNSNVDVCMRVDGCTWRHVITGNNGIWTADYSMAGDQPDEPVYDIKPGDSLDAAQYDTEGNGTGFDYWLPNPNFGTRPDEDRVEGWQWKLGTITIEIDDPATLLNPDFSKQTTANVADWDPNQTYFDLRFGGEYDLKPGDVVTVTDGTTTKAHVVTSLTVTSVDPTTDIVSGTAPADSRVDVWICNDQGCFNRHVKAEEGETGMVNAAQVADQFIPPVLWGYNETIEDYEYNPNLAETLLADAGYDGSTINLWVRDVPRTYIRHAVDTAYAIKGYLSAVGIDVNVEVLESGEFLERVRNGEADLFMVGWYVDFENPDNFYYYHFCEGGLQEFGLQYNDICEEIMAARAETDPAILEGLYEEIGQQVHEQIPVVPLVHVRTPTLIRHDVTGFNPSWLGAGSFANVSYAGGDFVYATSNAAPIFDPATSVADGHTYLVSNQVMETLVKANAGTATPLPGLAESWAVSPDGLTWTFTIRSGVTFHDGNPLNAEAVLYNIERWWDPAHPYHNSDLDYFTGLFGGFKGDPNSLIANVALIGTDQVQITLKEPFSPILSTLTNPIFAIASPAAIQSGSLGSHPVGTGPFVFVDQTADGTVHLQANSSYWGTPPSLTNLTFTVMPYETARFAALQANLVQGMEVDDWGYTLKAEEDTNLQVVWQPEMNVGYLGINQAHGPLSNVLVREAIAHAIDKQALVGQFYNTVNYGIGTWVADFGHPGDENDEQTTWDIKAGDSGDISQCDEDRDCTGLSWQEVYNPFLEVNPAEDEVVGFDWKVDTDVHLSINDPSTDGLDFTMTKVVHPYTYSEEFKSVVVFRLTGIFDIQPGFEITLDDGSTTRTIVVSGLQVDEVNASTDTISGTALAGTSVSINVCGPHGISGCAIRDVYADEDGNWSADLSIPGEKDYEKDTLDLVPGTDGTATQKDENGNRTIARLAIFTSPPAGFTPTNSVIVPFGEPIQLASVVDLSMNPNTLGEDLLNAIQLAIEDFGPIHGFSVEQTSFDSDCNNDFNTALNAAMNVIENPQFVGVIGHPCSFSFGAGLPLYEVAGLVTVSGSSSQFYTPRFGPTVSNRVTLNDYYYDNRIWTQIIQQMSSVQAWNTRYQMRFDEAPTKEYPVLYYDAAMLLLKRIAETAVLQPDGSLLVDRSALAAAVRGTQNYTGVTGSITLDQRGDRIHGPGGQANISPMEKLVWAPFWGIGETLTLHVYDQDGNLIYNPPPEEVRQAWFAPDNFPMAVFYYGDDPTFTMQPGYRVEVSNGEITTDVVAADMELTEVNIDTDRVTGIAAPGSDVFVIAWQDGKQRHVIADGNSFWMADFSVPGDEDFEQNTLDIEETTPFSIEQYYGSNNTYLAWPIPEIRGTVTLDGQPLAGVEVWLNGPKWDHENYNWYACTDANGRFVIQKLPPGPPDGFISATGPSVAANCSNAEFLDEDGKPLLVQYWDHINTIPTPTPFNMNFTTQPYHELQYNVVRAQAYHPFLVLMHIVDLAGSDACPGGAGTCDLPLNDVPLKAYDRNNNNAWVAWWTSGWGTWPDGSGELRYETLSDYTVEATYFDPDLNQDVVLTTPLDASAFTDRDDGVMVAPTVIFNYIKIIHADGTVEIYSDSDTDGDGQPDLLDPCPDDATNLCDPNGSVAGVIGSGGGTLVTENGDISINVPAGALAEWTTLSITDTGGGFMIDTNQGQKKVVTSFSVEPDGTQFAQPVAITFHWVDADNDGVVDGTKLHEKRLMVIKDGVVIAACANNSNCDMANNTLTVYVTSLSHFALAGEDNIPPTNVIIKAPINPVPITDFITVQADFNDPDPYDSHIVRIEWGDGTYTDVSVTGLTATAIHLYPSAGVYSITATVTDSVGESASAVFQYIVIYDPNGGYVTGAGWITSPTGAYTPNPSLTGKATFGFISKYQKGTTVPSGNTQFQFRTAVFTFVSTSYDWMVISGARAQYKGTGTINGTGEYKFMLTAIDGSPDMFRIKIWDKVTDEVIYDNQLGAADTADPATVIQGGSIVIHKVK